MTDTGGTQRLTRIIGKGRAVDMILAGEMLTAKKMEEVAGVVKGGSLQRSV